MTNSISFILDGRVRNLRFDSSGTFTPTTTLLNYLRAQTGHQGVKEGCAEGDCGACTIVIAELTPEQKLQYRAVDSCLVFLPMIHGKQLITVENLKSPDGNLHPVQQALVDSYGSQCGFCTPGIVMSIFPLFKQGKKFSKNEIAQGLAGTLCRCTGYRPIIDAAFDACGGDGVDHFSDDETRIIGLLRSMNQQRVSIETAEQRYDQPATLEECLLLLEQYHEAVVINGATDVALRVTKNFEVIPHIIDCSRIAEFRVVKRDDKMLSIGAGLKISELMEYIRSDFPALHKMLDVFGAEQIRNMGTLGGNLGTASPIGDTLPVLIAYDASIELQSRKGTRTIRADEFVKGYRKTERRADELITSISIPLPSPRSMVRSYKISKRRDLDISSLSAGFRVDLDASSVVKQIVLAFGGMADTTRRSRKAENFLIGKTWTRSTIEETQKFIDSDFDPISDVRGSAEFRKIAARNLLLKFWSETKT